MEWVPDGSGNAVATARITKSEIRASMILAKVSSLRVGVRCE